MKNTHGSTKKNVKNLSDRTFKNIFNQIYGRGIKAVSEVRLMLGNEAIARGAYEAGVKVSAAYPGTPSTEINESLAQYREVYCEWSSNEKTALETAIGASLSGVRAMASMKQVGVNVASDPLYTAAYMGVNGGLVLVAADDPGIYSSQNEQDTRCIAKAAQIPVLELQTAVRLRHL